MSKPQLYYDIDPEDIHPSMKDDEAGPISLGDVPADQTPVLHLDLDSDTVGQVLTVLQPYFQQFKEDEISTTFLSIYACDPVSRWRWLHLWDYLKRNIKEAEALSNEIEFILVLIGDPKNFLDIATDIHNSKCPKSLRIAVPASVIEHLTTQGHLSEDFNSEQIFFL